MDGILAGPSMAMLARSGEHAAQVPACGRRGICFSASGVDKGVFAWERRTPDACRDRRNGFTGTGRA